MHTASIMLVDDHPLLRKGLAQLISLEEHLNVSCEASSGEEAISLAPACQPDLILLDLDMKGMNGLDTLRALRQANIGSKIVMFTVSDNETDVLQALKFGADGYLLKDSEPEEVIEQISKAIEGELVLSAPLTQIVARSLQKSSTTSSLFEKLTKREVEILRHIARGDSNKVIGNSLGITEATVKVHIKNLLKKLSLRTRVEAAVWAVENKITL
ncbi:MAG: two-component system response regulator NarL [Gammaproteobacteria bacterium]|nr:MAG: two-component system response regulator NarL [Gammaproteobacteria bacterium]RLA18808.1 MAG: two-component system response regulator NarL [Gammaproteobacteria bacterium]